MKQKILYWIAVVAGAYAVKGLLIPIAAVMLVGGTESVRMLSYAVGGIISGVGVFAVSIAVAERDMCKFVGGARIVTFGIILMVR